MSKPSPHDANKTALVRYSNQTATAGDKRRSFTEQYVVYASRLRASQSEMNAAFESVNGSQDSLASQFYYNMKKQNESSVGRHILHAQSLSCSSMPVKNCHPNFKKNPSYCPILQSKSAVLVASNDDVRVSKECAAQNDRPNLLNQGIPLLSSRPALASSLSAVQKADSCSMERKNDAARLKKTNYSPNKNLKKDWSKKIASMNEKTLNISAGSKSKLQKLFAEMSTERSIHKRILEDKKRDKEGTPVNKYSKRSSLLSTKLPIKDKQTEKKIQSSKKPVLQLPGSAKMLYMKKKESLHPQKQEKPKKWQKLPFGNVAPKVNMSSSLVTHEKRGRSRATSYTNQPSCKVNNANGAESEGNCSDVSLPSLSRAKVLQCPLCHFYEGTMVLKCRHGLYCTGCVRRMRNNSSPCPFLGCNAPVAAVMKVIYHAP